MCIGKRKRLYIAQAVVSTGKKKSSPEGTVNAARRGNYT